MTTRLVVFDKDGTLIAWEVWDAVIGQVLNEVVAPALRPAAAEAISYDLAARRVLAGSPVIAASNAEVIDLVFPFADTGDRSGFHELVERRFAELAYDHVAPRDGATELLGRLSEAGIARALCTNDSEAAARSQVAKLGWADLLPTVFGHDSGHGAKPGGGMLVAALAAHGCAPNEALMVGDSDADVLAASTAGVRSVYLGDDPAIARRADMTIDRLANLADVVVTA